MLSVYSVQESSSSNQKHSTSRLTDEEFLEQKLEIFNLKVPKGLFSYSYETEILSTLSEKSFELDPAIEKLAKKKYLHLNNSPLFDVSFLIQPKKVRDYQTKKKHYKNNVGALVEFTTKDGETIHGTYFDRDSDTLFVIGPGFTNEREKMAPFTHMFDECDLIFFDYRGHGYQEAKFWDPSTWDLNFFHTFFGIDPQKARLGLDEEKDVIAVINGMKKRKKYNAIVGIGICYSALIFSKTAALYPKAFTHLIFDGCWLSLDSITDKMLHDLRMVCTPQRGGWGNFWLTTQKWGRDLLKNLGQALFRLDFKAISVLDFVPYIKEIPILYFYGKDDLMIS